MSGHRFSSGTAMTKDHRRLNRQFDALGRSVPPARGLVQTLAGERLRPVRLPAAVLLVFGGFLGFLPVLGFWMLPLGLLLLAVDLPAVRPYVSSATIQVRRRFALLRRRWRGGA
jgi:hypothetical protein